MVLLETQSASSFLSLQASPSIVPISRSRRLGCRRMLAASCTIWIIDSSCRAWRPRWGIFCAAIVLAVQALGQQEADHVEILVVMRRQPARVSERLIGGPLPLQLLGRSQKCCRCEEHGRS